MKWKISFYSNKVEEEPLNFPTGILANFIHIAEMVEDYAKAIGYKVQISFVPQVAT